MFVYATVSSLHYNNVFDECSGVIYIIILYYIVYGYCRTIAMKKSKPLSKYKRKSFCRWFLAYNKKEKKKENEIKEYSELQIM